MTCPSDKMASSSAPKQTPRSKPSLDSGLEELSSSEAESGHRQPRSGKNEDLNHCKGDTRSGSGKGNRHYEGHAKGNYEEGVESAGRNSQQSSTERERIYYNEEAVDVEDVGGRVSGGKTRGRTPSRSDDTPRLLVISNKIKNSTLLQTATYSNVTFVHYKYESATLESLLGSIAQHLGSKRVGSIAFILHSSSSSINLTGKDDKGLTKDNMVEHQALIEFFLVLKNNHLDMLSPDVRFDFLSCTLAQSSEGGAIAKGVEDILGIPVGISKDIIGSGIPVKGVEEGISVLGELYFRMDRLKSWSGHNQQSLAGFEKIRTVGKGAYGTAVLYRKKDDDSLVILKEINLHDLNAAERQLALNEVRVLAMLDHPNIISYYDSFEEDGTVMIEMEYADGGTLAQFLSQQDKPLDEREILAMFQQMVAAIKHIHEHNTLHRDLKTANIFLTKEGVVKVGDFGISKMMTTGNRGANTVLGTPYYISPEMCEGKEYHHKSDIWALGCILYEMACLQKTFEGSNLPALVNKIMKGQFAPVKENYSQEFKNLIRDMLRREPEHRPSATDLWHERLPELMSCYEDPVTDVEEDILTPADGKNLAGKRRTRSVLYYFDLSSMALNPVVLPSKVKIRNVAVGADHVIVVTVERLVFTWGEGGKGQLGHGTSEARAKPEPVESLRGKSITKACCGEGFSVFASDNGIVMTCGDGRFGCLGHGDWCSTSRPRLIEALLSVDVVSIACGLNHVVAVGCDGEVFSWGKGADGRLGLNSEENQCQPMEVTFTDDSVCVRDARCGRDGTMLITDVGSVFACGNNEYNKLGLNQRQGFLMAMKNIFNKTEVEGEKVFTLVRALARHRVIDVSLGPHHTAVIVEPGHVYTLGKNLEGQLGTGNTKPQNAPIEVKIFEERPAFRVQCGEFYSVAGTTENDLLFWGTRFKNPQRMEDVRTPAPQRREVGRQDSASSQAPPSSRPASTTSISSVSSYKDSGAEGPPAIKSQESVEHHKDSVSSRRTERQTSSDSASVFYSSSQPGDKMNTSQASSGSGGFRPLSSTPRRSTSASSRGEREKVEVVAKEDTDLIQQPTPLMKLDSSGSHSQTGETVSLSNFFCHGENLFLQVETTAPPPKRKSRKRRYFRKRLTNSALTVPTQIQTSASSRDGGDEYSSEASELDTMAGTIPAWIKQELAHSEREITDGNDPDDSDDEVSSPTLDSSLSSIQINRNMKQSSRGVGERITGDTSAHGHMPKSSKVIDPGTGVDPLSSSSSSDAISATFRANDSKVKAVQATRKTSLTPSRKITAPAPFKSKMGPQQSQKPLNRIRAQSKGRGRSSQEKDTISIKSGIDEVKVNEDLTALQGELEKLREEKRKTEERLKKIEEENRRHKEHMNKETEEKAVAREVALKEEINLLRREFLEQNSKLRENYNVVMSLQEQLVKVQSEQVRMSARETPQRTSSRQSVKESKICAVQ